MNIPGGQICKLGAIRVTRNEVGLPSPGLSDKLDVECHFSGRENAWAGSQGQKDFGLVLTHR